MNYNKFIDHTLLKADATKEQIEKLCFEAKEYDFASVCVNAYWVKTAYEILKDTDVKVCTVIGFPLGATSSESKAFEVEQAIKDGASELDMVINIGEVKAKNKDAIIKDIKAVVEAAKGNLVKVIIETCLLTDEEKVLACLCAKEAGADFVKTSTGFSTGGANEHDVKLMYDTVGDTMKVKASGGIRTREDMLKMIAANASRIGASAGIKLISEE